MGDVWKGKGPIERRKSISVLFASEIINHGVLRDKDIHPVNQAIICT